MLLCKKINKKIKKLLKIKMILLYYHPILMNFEPKFLMNFFHRIVYNFKYKIEGHCVSENVEVM